MQLRSRGCYVFVWDRTFLQLIAFSDQQSYTKVSQVVLVVKNPPANARDTGVMGSIPGSGRSPEGGHATHSSILAWRIPWTEELGRLQSIGSQRIRHNWSDLAYRHAILYKEGPHKLKLRLSYWVLKSNSDSIKERKHCLLKKDLFLKVYVSIHWTETKPLTY